MGTPSTNLAPPPNNNNSLSTTLSSAANFTAPHHPPTPEPHSFHQGQQKQQQQKQKQKQRQYHHQDDDPNVWKQQDHHYSSRVQRQESTGGGGSWLSVFSGSATKERSLSSSPSISPDSDTEILFDSRGEDDTMNDLEEDERKYGQPVHRAFARFPRRRSSSASSLDTFTTATKRQQRRRGGAGGLRSTGSGWFTRLQKRYFIWKRQRRRLYSLIRLVVLALLSVAVVFTTLELLLGFDFDGDDGPLRTGGGGGRVDRAKAHFKSFDYNLRELRLRRKQSTKRRSPSVFDVQAQNYTRHFWELPIQDHLGGGSSIDINEDYMLSKAFAGAMQPTRVIPFYFRASERFPKKMVTITTLITPDRFQVFCRLVHQYQGPISVATHIRLDENPDEQFRILNELWATHAELGRFVDLHVVVDKIDFQLNMWRNIGRLFARTDYFMMLDVDFHIPSGFKRRLHEDKRIQELLEQGAALVIPAFEYSAETDPKDSFYFPDTKRDLVNLHEKGYIRVFHDFFPPGHNATDYSTWFGLSGVQFKGFFNSKNQPVAPALPPMSPPVRIENGRLVPIPDDQQEPYKITTFQPKYEPYIIVKREGTPWCDERFVGYGGNKAACLFEIYASGIDFYVMPQDFLIHQFHDYRDNDRKNGRILNRQIFINFQQESCFKYLETMILTGEWYTPKANNLREQCEVFDGFLKTADALAREYEAKHPNSLLRHRVFVPDDNNLKAHHQQQQQQGGNGDDRRLPPHHPIGNRYGEGSGSGGGGSAASSEDDGLFYHLLHGTIGLQGGKVWGGITPKTYYTDPEAAMLPPSAASSSSSSFSSSNSSPQQGQKPAATAAAVAGGGNIDVDGEPIAPSEEDAKEDRGPATNAQAEEVVPKDTHVDQDHLDAFRAGHLVPGAVPFSFHRDRDEEPGGTAAGEERVAEEGAEKKVVEDGERGDGSTQSVQVQQQQQQQDQPSHGQGGTNGPQQQQQQGNNEVAKEAEDPTLYHHKWTPPIPNMDRSPAQSKMADADNNAVSNDQQSFEQAAEKMEDSVLEMLRSKPDTVK
ncbi:hypothetical protein DFQ26_008683 [Actinomortierella ambigua]|nr:hypothetical protein DFQ26_008683 [Actinomortierella ambigua]